MNTLEFSPSLKRFKFRALALWLFSTLRIPLKRFSKIAKCLSFSTKRVLIPLMYFLTYPKAKLDLHKVYN